MICTKCTGETTMLSNDLCIPCYQIAQDKWQAKMAIRQDPSQFDLDKLVRLLLTQHWMHECTIVPEYMPPFPRSDTTPTCQVSYTYENGDKTWLRYGRGPLQGYFWDVYGEDMHSPELALIAISNAPAPPRVGVVIATHGR